jgi:NAD(P)-dependent dehydrogenase (short-subunit alcohol dehydrogenase family)
MAAELGGLDTLINNAGVMLLGPAAGAPLREWRAGRPHWQRQARAPGVGDGADLR